VTSFGAAGVSSYRIVGTEAVLRVEPAYDHESKPAHHLTRGGTTRRRTFARRDRFAPELVHFSRCILEHHEPVTSGREGLADVRVIRALYEAASRGRPVQLAAFAQRTRPGLGLGRLRPPVGRQQLVQAEPPTE
jgi:predicted dehydrogenase